MSTGALGVALDAFADEVGATDPVTICGLSTRGGPVGGVRVVTAPSGIDGIQPAEMTLRCGAGTPVAEVAAALAEVGQCVAVPDGGTIGGALAVGRSGLRRLGWGPVRDTVLQVRYVSADGNVVTAGGPTVKNVSGFDLCRLMVGSLGTLGFLAEVILRTRPLPVAERWFSSRRDPWDLVGELYRPSSVLWDGETTWVLLDGHPDDVADQARVSHLDPADGPPALPPHRRSIPPAQISSLPTGEGGAFVAEIGVGVIHQEQPPGAVPIDPVTASLHARIKAEFDPRGRLNPGLDVLSRG